MAPPVIHPADRISRLPEEIQAQILSFLPAHEAVRTCVLGRAWRHVWKFTSRLFITGGTVEEVQEFVDRLLGLRLNGLNCAPLDECEIRFRMVDQDFVDWAEDNRTVSRWIHTSLKCQVQALRVLNYGVEHGLIDYFVIFDDSLFSPHLTRLELSGIWFQYNDELRWNSGIWFPALEHLEITNCLLSCVRKIVSPSVKRLVITGCKAGKSTRFKISAPCLVSLRLEVGSFKTPILENMPELVEAYVKINSYAFINCVCDDPMDCCHSMTPGSCITDSDADSKDEEDSDADSDNEEDTKHPKACVLLEGLAQAKHLVLLAHHSRSIFRRDLRMCPTFSNMKTLILNGYWCESADCRPLACILEHAPVLENLTVVFSAEVELKYDIVLEGHPDVTAESTMITHCLKTVKVKCHTVDEGVQNVLKFLSTLNICFNSD